MPSISFSNDVPQFLIQSKQPLLAKHWETLDVKQQKSLRHQLEQIDFEQLAQLIEQATNDAEGTESVREKAQRATAPKSIVLQPKNKTEQEEWNRATELGLQQIQDGKVAAILVAGGQGTRLGFPHPKGMFPIGPVSNATLFQLFFEQLKAVENSMGVTIPYAIMTSEATHQETKEFLSANDHFGLDPTQVTLFQQGTMPAVDATTGELLLADRCHLCLSPDGHGGIVQALKNSGLLQQWEDAGIETLFYHQVDNPTAIVCDPALIGFHLLQNSEMTTKVARKRSANERMGVLAEVDDVLGIIEYSDMPR